MSASTPMSSYHKRVLAIGLPAMLLSAGLFLYYGNRAVSHSDESMTRHARTREFVHSIFTGQNVRDAEALPSAQFFFVAMIVSMVGLIALVAIPAIRAERLARTSQVETTPQVVTVVKPFAVGDDISWSDSAGEPANGTVEHVHYGPFTVDRGSVYASYERPGYTVRRADGTLLGLDSNLVEKR